MSARRLLLSSFLGFAVATSPAQDRASRSDERIPPGPRDAPAVGWPGYDGPVAVFEWPADALADEPLRYDRKGSPEEVAPVWFGDPYFLGFAGGVHRPPHDERIDPRLAERTIRPALAHEDPEVTWGYVIFAGRITDDKRARVESLGVTLLRYHPNNAYAARIPLAVAVELSLLPEVRWVGYPPAELKLHPALRAALERSSLEEPHDGPAGTLPVHVALYETDRSAHSHRVRAADAFTLDPGRGVSAGDPGAAGWRLVPGGPVQRLIEALGGVLDGYVDAADAHRAFLTPEQILALVAVDRVGGLELALPYGAGHDWMVPQVAQDYRREIVRVSTQTVGVIDSGFAVLGGTQANGGHVDLAKFAVGWNWWNGGGCGSAFCDEVAEGFHGSHVLGTIAGTGSANVAMRGNSPYLGSAANLRLFLAKCYCTDAFQNMRSHYVDPGGVITQRPWAVSNSWRSGGCAGTTGRNFIGSEVTSRVVDDEVFGNNQLYVFCAGNEGTCGMGCGTAGTLGDPSVAKNALAVGMVNDYVGIEGDPGAVNCGSSRGPCGDGRWKPNVVAPGCSTTSVDGSTTNGYSAKCGCSMATPAVTGALSGVAETYLEFRRWSSLARAWTMATAMPWQDATSATPGGWLPTAHLNAYGMGRLSALKAHDGGGALPWRRNWAYGDVLSETDTFDLVVEPNVARLVVVMTYDDPQANLLANPAIVEDIDLYVDREPFDPAGNAGEYRSWSTIQTVEHIVLENPAPGNYRVKIHPFTRRQRILWGCMVVQIFGDTNAPVQLSGWAQQRWVRPGQPFAVGLDVSVGQYLASNVYLDSIVNPFQGDSSRTTLKDGVVLANRDVAGDILLGDVLAGDPRSIQFQLRDTWGRDRDETIRFQARSDNGGRADLALPVGVDGTPPPTPVLRASTTHQPGVWSNQRTIQFTYIQLLDNLSGVTGIGTSVSSSSPVPPPTVVSGPNTGTVVHGLTQDTSGSWVAIASVDAAGNWSATSNEQGPFLVDTVRPSVPGNLASSSHPISTWSSDPQLVMTWTASSDDRSGVVGYGHGFGVPPTTPTLGTVTTHVETLPASGVYAFGLRAIDAAGNPSVPASYGPIWFDQDPPTNVRLEIDGGATVARSLDVALAIDALDVLSGLADLRLRNDGGQWSAWEPFVTTRSWNLANGGGSTSLGGRWVELEVRDAAGNVAYGLAAIYLIETPRLYGNACPGSAGLPTFEFDGTPGIGFPMVFDVGNTNATLGALYGGVSDASWLGLPLPLELGPFGAPGCWMNASFDLELANVVLGTAAVFVTIPPDPALADAVLFLQWLLVGDPQAFVTSTAGLRIVIAGP